MYYIYIIQSMKNGQYYVGSTQNLEQRLKEHNSGKSKSTSPFLPYRLVYRECFRSLSEAREREFYIKKRKSRKYIESLIKLRKR